MLHLTNSRLPPQLLERGHWLERLQVLVLAACQILLGILKFFAFQVFREMLLKKWEPLELLRLSSP